MRALIPKKYFFKLVVLFVFVLDGADLDYLREMILILGAAHQGEDHGPRTVGPWVSWLLLGRNGLLLLVAATTPSTRMGSRKVLQRLPFALALSLHF